MDELIAALEGADRWPSIHRKKDGYLMVRPNGHCRFMTLWEAFKYRWFGHIPTWLGASS